MRIAIHHQAGDDSYSDKWIEYCKKNNIDYKLGNWYDGEIQGLSGTLFWGTGWTKNPLTGLLRQRSTFSGETGSQRGDPKVGSVAGWAPLKLWRQNAGN